MPRGRLLLATLFGGATAGAAADIYKRGAPSATPGATPTRTPSAMPSGTPSATPSAMPATFTATAQGTPQTWSVQAGTEMADVLRRGGSHYERVDQGGTTYYIDRSTGERFRIVEPTGKPVPTYSAGPVGSPVPGTPVPSKPVPPVFNPVEYGPSAASGPTEAWRGMTSEQLMNGEDASSYDSRRERARGAEANNTLTYSHYMNLIRAAEEGKAREAEAERIRREQTDEGTPVPVNWGEYDKARARKMAITPSTDPKEQLAALQAFALKRFNNDQDDMRFNAFLGKYTPSIMAQIQYADVANDRLVAANEHLGRAQERYTKLSQMHTDVVNEIMRVSQAGEIDSPGLKDQADELRGLLDVQNNEVTQARVAASSLASQWADQHKVLTTLITGAYGELGGTKVAYSEQNGILYGVVIDELTHGITLFTPTIKGDTSPGGQAQTAARVQAVVESVRQDLADGTLATTPQAAAARAVPQGVPTLGPGGVGLVLPSAKGGGASGPVPVQPDVRYERNGAGEYVRNVYDLRTNALLSSSKNLTDKDYVEIFGPRVMSLNPDGSQTLQYGATGPRLVIDATPESIAKANDLYSTKPEADKLTLEKLRADAKRQAKADELAGPKSEYDLARQYAIDAEAVRKAARDRADEQSKIQIKEQEQRLAELVSGGKLSVPQALRFLGKFQEAAIEVERARQNFEAERGRRMEERTKAQQFADQYETEDQITSALNASGGTQGQQMNVARRAALAKYPGTSPGQQLAAMRGFDLSYKDPGLFADTDAYRGLNAPIVPDTFGLKSPASIISDAYAGVPGGDPLGDFLKGPEYLNYKRALGGPEPVAVMPGMPEYFSTTMR